MSLGFPIPRGRQQPTRRDATLIPLRAGRRFRMPDSDDATRCAFDPRIKANPMQAGDYILSRDDSSFADLSRRNDEHALRFSVNSSLIRVECDIEARKA